MGNGYAIGASDLLQSIGGKARGGSEIKPAGPDKRLDFSNFREHARGCLRGIVCARPIIVLLHHVGGGQQLLE